MKTAIKVTTEGEVTVIDLGDDTLSILQAGVGGLIEPVDYRNDLTMWINEEGTFNGSERNPVATSWWNMIHPDHFNIIFGDIVFTGGTDEDGETLGLTDIQGAALLDFVEMVIR